MLVDALSTEMLKDFVYAVNAIQNGLEKQKRSSRIVSLNSITKQRRKNNPNSTASSINTLKVETGIFYHIHMNMNSCV